MIDFNRPFDRTGTNCWKWDAEGNGAKYPMGCADTDFPMPKEIIDALHAKIDQGVIPYNGSSEYAYIAFTDYCNRQYETVLKPSDVCDAMGATLGIRVILDAFTNVGDKVIIQSPVFNYFNDTVENAGRRIVDNIMTYDRESGYYNINFEDLECLAKDPRTKLLILCNPSNPTGRAYSTFELSKMYDICNRNGVLILSDEIHSDFYHKGLKHNSIMALSEEIRNNSIMLTGPGKTFNTLGFYTAFVVIPNKELQEKYRIAYKNLRADVIDLGLVAAHSAYTYCDDYVASLRKHISHNVDIVENFLKNNDIEVKLTHCDATYLLWLDFKSWNMTSEQLDILLREYGIVFTKGHQFGPNCDGFMRMNVATQTKNVEEALELLRKIYEDKINI